MTRSPSYPSHDLERAIAYARRIYDADGCAEAAKKVILQHMGFTGESGPAGTALASLRQYGLLEGRGDKYKLTHRALDILLAPNDSQERSKALRDAALDPPIFKEIWEKYSGHLPSDQNLRYYLEKDRGFNKNAVEGVVKALRATVQFAGVDGSRMDWTPQYGGAAGPSGELLQSPPPETPLIPLTIPDARNVRLIQIPRMSSKAFELFKKQLDLFRSVIVTDPDEEGAES
jgi:hypothetical protein